MGIFNMVWYAIECPKCGTRKETSCDFKEYGSLDIMGYRLGSKMQWTGHRIMAARDRKLRYLQVFQGGECTGCGAVIGPGILIIRNDIMERIHFLPVVDPGEPAPPDAFKAWERMLIYRHHSPEAVQQASIWAADRYAAKSWREFIIEIRKRAEALLRKVEALGEGVPVPAEYWIVDMEWHRANNPFPPDAVMRTAILNKLVGMEDFSPTTDTNFISYPYCCPACRNEVADDIPFAYGPCNGYVYDIGDSIDWSKPGRIAEPRDNEVRYVTSAAKPCKSCGYTAHGWVTVENDAIASAFIWPKELRDLLDQLPADQEAQTPLDMFLFAREFGVRSYTTALRQVIEEKGGVLENGFDAADLYRYLLANYAQETGREYQ